MEFTCTTQYDHKAMTALARARRKTVRRKQSRRAHLLSWAVAAIGISQLVPPPTLWKTALIVFALALVLGSLLFEDRLDGFAAVRQVSPRGAVGTAHFPADGAVYRLELPNARSEFRYAGILALAETPEYFVFLTGESHGQVYDKHTLTGGTADEFRTFLQSATGLSVQPV